MAGKRPNGQGTLYKDKSRARAPWVFEKDAPRADGSVQRLKVRGRTQAEVLKRMAEREREAALTNPASDELTFEAFLDRWLAFKKPLVRASTHRGYKQDVELYIKPVIGPKPLGRVGVVDVQAVVTTVASRGTLTAADRARRTMKQALGQAVKWNMLAFNPCDRLDPVRRPEPKRSVWSHDQGERFLRAAAGAGTSWHALFTLALATGLRKGELLGLRWKDVTTERVFVRQAYTQYGDEQFTPPKTRQSVRSVPITDSTRAALERHRTTAPKSDLDLVFPRWDGGPLDPRTVTAELHRLCDDAKVPRIRFHDLRRTFTTWQFAAGQEPKTVQRLLGHATPSLTLSVYADVLEERERVSALEVPGSNVGGNADELARMQADAKRVRRRMPKRSRREKPDGDGNGRGGS